MNGGELHLWSGRLIATPDDVQCLYGVISPDEREKSHRYRFERDKNRYIIGRGLLRAILGNYLGSPPNGVSLKYGPKGKPSLKNFLEPLYFNVSHSEDRVLCAFSSDCEVGVDVEVIRRLFDADAIARRFFAKRECNDIFLLEGEERNVAFFRCWTRKEAFLKGIGEGLSVPLDQFEVPVSAAYASEITIRNGEAQLASDWHLLDFQSDADCVAAIAVRTLPNNIIVSRFKNVRHCLDLLTNSANSVRSGFASIQSHHELMG